TLSIYLYINPSSEDWRIHLKNGLKNIAEDIKTTSDDDETNLIQHMTEKGNNAIKDNKANLKKSVICFINEEHQFMYNLQLEVENEFQWQNGPAEKQLEELMKSYPKSGIILIQHNQVTLLTTALGELIDETQFTFDLESEDWKQ